jgi:hypothetical protein
LEAGGAAVSGAGEPVDDATPARRHRVVVKPVAQLS